MGTVILCGDLVGEKTLPAPGFEPSTFSNEFLFAAAVPILTLDGFLVLSPPFKLQLYCIITRNGPMSHVLVVRAAACGARGP